MVTVDSQCSARALFSTEIRTCDEIKKSRVKRMDGRAELSVTAELRENLIEKSVSWLGVLNRQDSEY